MVILSWASGILVILGVVIMMTKSLLVNMLLVLFGSLVVCLLMFVGLKYAPMTAYFLALVIIGGLLLLMGLVIIGIPNLGDRTTWTNPFWSLALFLGFVISGEANLESEVGSLVHNFLGSGSLTQVQMLMVFTLLLVLMLLVVDKTLSSDKGSLM